MPRYNVKVFTNSKPQTYIESIGKPDGSFKKETAEMIASQVNAIFYQLAVNCYAEVSEVEHG